MASNKRAIPEINAGSMADIAFLLLIFFLVTTTMDSDKGIPNTLPPKPTEVIDNVEINERNVLEILVNANNDLLVENNLMNIEELTEYTKRFLTNNGVDPNLSVDPSVAVVSLKNDRGTSYETYIKVQNELNRAYNELRNDESIKTFGIPYEELEAERKKKINKVIPKKLSEAEPENAFNN